MAVQAQPHFPSYGDWIDSVNGCGGGTNQFFSSYPHYHQQQSNSQIFQNSYSVNDSSSSPKIDNHSSLSHLQSMAAYEDKQRQEIDHYIRLQGEKLRLLMHNQRKQQIAVLMKKIESKALPLLRKKDQEIALATKRTVELEDFVRRLEIENQAWQRAAQENEAMVVSLSATIEQVREKAATSAEDAESCCDEGEAEQPIREAVTVTACKGCDSRNSCVLFLPCRHLCSCKACEPFLDCCPVCLAGKKASIEALIV